MAKILVMKFLNEEGKSSNVRLNNVKDDVTGTEVNLVMDTIIEKNVFPTIGGDFVSKDSAYLTETTKEDIEL
ncbi:MAG: DUF2922 domain-containing protein [Clostridiaceae bacterium]